MKKFNAYQAVLFILLSLFILPALAWDHSIELGYGYSHDPNHTKYNNSGFLLTSDVYPISRSCKTFWSLNAGLGQWRSTAPRHQNLTTAAVAVALRYYPFMVYNYPSYLLLSAGPAYLTTRKFGKNKQGSNFAFQVNGGVGMEFKNIDANLRIAHYSNAYLARPDHGFTVLYLFSIGYLF